MAYNMTGFDNSTNIYEMFVAVNTSSDNWLSYFFILGVFIVLLINLMRRNPPAESFVAASGATTMLCLLFLIGNLINVVWLVGFTLLFAISAVSLYITNKT